MSIKLVNYESLMLDIRGEVFKAQQNISRIVTRQKVEMSWKVGKSINEYLIISGNSGYGKKLFEQLADDVGLNIRVLYQMSAFHKKYPELPKDDGVLNWTHYRGLVGVEDDEKRKYFENLAIENNMGGDALRREISQERSVENKKKTAVKKKLNVVRGELFNYKIIEEQRLGKKFVDCGFNIFSEIVSDFGAQDGILHSIKKGENFEFRKSNLSAKKTHTYKAFIDRVVDGDTLRVTLDLGFGILHKEILRLSNINAPERGSLGAKKATQFLKDTLDNVEFVVIKTNKTDIYGRYIADIFLLKGEKDPHNVASEGEYLSQILFDSGLVNII